MGEVEEIALGKIEKRRAQEGRQLQIVCRVEQHIDQRQQVENGNMAGDRQPVSAGRRKPLGAKGADDLLEQRAALLQAGDGGPILGAAQMELNQAR